MQYPAAPGKGGRTASYMAECVVQGSYANIHADQRGQNESHNLSNTHLSLHKDPHDVVQTYLHHSTCQL